MGGYKRYLTELMEDAMPDEPMCPDDLIDEGQITGDADQIQSMREAASPAIFHFVKETPRKLG